MQRFRVNHELVIESVYQLSLTAPSFGIPPAYPVIRALYY